MDSHAAWSRLNRLLAPSLLVVFGLLLSSCDTFVAQEASHEAHDVESFTEASTANFTVTQTDDNCTEGIQSSGALYEVCVPPGGLFNGTLVVYAHGFVFPQQPLALPDDALDGVSAKSIILAQGFAYAASSYYTNGLVDPQKGVKDLRELIVIYNQLYGKTSGRAERVILVGFSNGAFLATVAMERQAELFDGALASCGPLGDYYRQIEYYGDVLVLFQAFFPGVIPGGPDGMPEEFVNQLGADGLGNLVLAALSAHPDQAQLFFTVLAGTSAIVGTDPLFGSLPPLDQATLAQLAGVLVNVLAYAVFPVNDAIMKLGGSPYGNLERVYGDLLGPEWAALVAAVNGEGGVQRYEAHRGALAQLQGAYKTTGNLKAPLVALHNRFDPIVPYWQETHYQAELSVQAADRFHLITAEEPVGHCDFTLEELFGALDVLLQEVSSSGPLVARSE